jgi:hypothetical protein
LFVYIVIEPIEKENSGGLKFHNPILSVPFSKCETFIYDWPCIANRCIDDWSEGIITQTSNEVLLIFPVYVIIGLVRIEIHLYSICLYIYVKFGHNNFPMVINSSNSFP